MRAFHDTLIRRIQASLLRACVMTSRFKVVRLSCFTNPVLSIVVSHSQTDRSRRISGRLRSHAGTCLAVPQVRDHSRRMQNRFTPIALTSVVVLMEVACTNHDDDVLPSSIDDHEQIDNSMCADAGPDLDDLDLTVQSIAGGNFYGFAEDSEIRGQGLMVRMADATRAELHVEGLAPMTAYTAHVHVLPCEVNQGGDHYKIDPSVAGTVEENEIWFMFTTNADGAADDEAFVSMHTARMDAQSIVIHAPDGSKLACSNLRLGPEESATLQGDFSPVPGTAETIAGSVAVTVDYTAADNNTMIDFHPTGLNPDVNYIAHVHELPCDVDVGGGHYKIDPTIEETIEENEIWIEFDVAEDGTASAHLSVDHILRADAQSVVIHRQEDGMEPKVACADLRRAEYPDYVVSKQGDTVIFPEGEMMGFDPEVTSAMLTRKNSGTTVAEITVGKGLEACVEYPVHVHVYTCETNQGGDHYKLDPTIAETIEENEIWLTLTADYSGCASATNEVEQIVRPDASSIVIHSPVAPYPKLACINLGFAAPER